MSDAASPGRPPPPVLRRIAWTRYRVPFAVPFETAHGQTTHREGLLLRLTASNGTVGLGEAAPLPEFGGGTVAAAEASLRRLIPHLSDEPVGAQALSEAFQRMVGDGPESAALRCAVDVAVLDLLSRRAGVPMASLLAPRYQRAVPVNATVGAAAIDAAVALARRAVAAGFGTIKLKVGVAGSVAAEVARVAAVRAAIGAEIGLRLDANGAWEPERAVATLGGLRGLAIELIEQPVPASDIDGLARVRAADLVPVAADEAMTGLAAARRLIARGAADVLIVKPMVVGGLSVAGQIIDEAVAAGLGAVVTTSLESGIGVASCLHLAATLPPGSPACGLATADLLADDLIHQHPAITQGRMVLPDRAGLGVELDELALSRFAVGPCWRTE